MFDLRYHVASLAAVFLALLIGILVGVGIADRGYVDKAQRGLLEQRISKLESDLRAARQNAESLRAQQRATEAFVTDTYPTLMANRLRGKSLAEELAGGGKAPLWTTLAEQIVAERAGSEQRPADGVIVVRTAGKQYDGTASFLQGFYSGLIAAP
ncbi:MAG TPA: copper transporter, partial [Gaiellaceae bacterium]|nr:copper transporter [Gaiellaceae bacterium]